MNRRTVAGAVLSSVIASVAAAQTWRDDQLCGESLPAPAATQIAGCASAACVGLVGSTRVCACLPEDQRAATGAPSLRFVILDGDHERQRWSITEFSTLYGGPPERFAVTRAELSGDDRADYAVAFLDAVSNGMGIAYTSLFVLDGADLSRPPATVTVEDWGGMGLLTRAPGARHCQLLRTQWGDGSEPARGPGLYLVGQWLRLREGQLRPLDDRPVVCRRFLISLEKLRASPPRPVRWFADRRAQTEDCPTFPCR